MRRFGIGLAVFGSALGICASIGLMIAGLTDFNWPVWLSLLVGTPAIIFVAALLLALVDLWGAVIDALWQGPK